MRNKYYIKYLIYLMYLYKSILYCIELKEDKYKFIMNRQNNK
jgi:hypothetical protein